MIYSFLLEPHVINIPPLLYTTAKSYKKWRYFQMRLSALYRNDIHMHIGRYCLCFQCKWSCWLDYGGWDHWERQEGYRSPALQTLHENCMQFKFCFFLCVAVRVSIKPASSSIPLTKQVEISYNNNGGFVCGTTTTISDPFVQGERKQYTIPDEIKEVIYWLDGLLYICFMWHTYQGPLYSYWWGLLH